MRKLLIVPVALLATALAAPSASAIDEVNTNNLRKQIGLPGLLEHERALQRIAIAHDNTRAAATPGYDASVDYVMRRMRRAGYRVRKHEFDFPNWTQNGAATLQFGTKTYTEGTDYVVAQFSGSGDVSAKIVPTNDITIPPPGGAGSSTSGCEASDYPADTSGNIALIQRGTCPFVQKIQAAKDAGAAAVLIFNDGFEGRTDAFEISGVPYVGIPVAMTTSAAGEELYAAAGQTVRFTVDATTTRRAQYNVIADSYEGKRNRTILVGGHLDSVEEGPGINDNGSGVSAMLETAEQIAELPRPPRNRLRFAFWGAEEAGLIGSTAYVRDLLENGRLKDVEANINFDMLASPNFARFVYDGDNSSGEGSVGPPGSAEIEQLFLRYFEDKELPTDPTAFDGRSDYGEFIANGVPAGGLFSGAEGIKTLEQEARYGGFAGMPYDECYHLACDSFFNLNWQSLDQMSDAVAHATWTLARSRSPLVGGTTAAARAKRAKKAKQARRSAKRMAYRGHFQVR
jgi:Zn-dependent M28 family amino/carboxypeptidase